MLKPKLQYFGHLMRRSDSLEKTLILGKTEGRRRRERQRMRWLDGITDSMDMSLRTAPEVNDGQGSLACCSPWGHKELDTTERLNWKLVLLPAVTTMSEEFLSSRSFPRPNSQDPCPARKQFSLCMRLVLYMSYHVSFLWKTLKILTPPIFLYCELVMTD